MQHKMPVISEEKRQALIEWAKNDISALQTRIDCAVPDDTLIPYVKDKLLISKIALASLEAQPIYQVEKDNYKNHPPSDAGDWVSWIDCDLATARKGDYYGLLVRTLYQSPPCAGDAANP